MLYGVFIFFRCSNFVKESKWHNSVSSGPIHTKPGPISIIYHSRRRHHHHRLRRRRRGRRRRIRVSYMLDCSWIDGSNFVKESKWHNSISSGPIYTKLGPISITYHSRRSHHHHHLRRRRRGCWRRCRIRVYSSSRINVLIANPCRPIGTDPSLILCMPYSTLRSATWSGTLHAFRGYKHLKK